jgi:hypothetical protein
MHQIEDFNGVPCLLSETQQTVTMDYTIDDNYDLVPNFEGRTFSFGREDRLMTPAFMVAVLCSWVFTVAARNLVALSDEQEQEVISAVEWFVLACRGGALDPSVQAVLTLVAEHWRKTTVEVDRVLDLATMVETLLLAKDKDQALFCKRASEVLN